MSIEDNTRYTHKIYENDPTLFESYINQHVTIAAKDSSVHHGILYTVDPVSESVILIQQEDNKKFNAKVLVGHSIDKIELTTNAGMNLPEFFPMTQLNLSPIQLTERKEAIKKLMIEKRLSIKDNNGVLIIENMLSIEPPYQIENCICSNAIIMSRIQNILQTEKI